jgi:pimeloyl-ACP methyl ester carboxylesterase
MKRPIFAIPLFFSMSVVIVMMLIVFAFASMANNTLAYTTSIKNSTMTTANALSFSLDNIQTKKVRVGDIDIAYKIFGQGEPLLLIPGFSMTMDIWGPVTLEKLSSNHTIIIFDNRGIGKTTVGNKAWSIGQFANDTAGLIDALGIKKPVDVLGVSWGGYVAQELTLMRPQKVNKLILYGTDCGGKATIFSPQISPQLGRSIESGNVSIDTFLSILFPKEWIKQNAAYVQKVFSTATPVPKENIQHQAQTTHNWKGTCDRLSSITKPTLVVTGTDDIVRPPANSIMLAEKIPGAWLIQIRGGGHYVMFQYPEQFTAVLETFLQ